MRSVGLILGLQYLNLLGSHDVTNFLDMIWAPKLEWLRAHAIEMKLVKIANADEVLEVEGGELKDALAWVRLNQGYCTRTQLVRLVQNAVDNGSPTEVLRLVQYTWERLEENVKSIADPFGWFEGNWEPTLPQCSTTLH